MPVVKEEYVKIYFNWYEELTSHLLHTECSRPSPSKVLVRVSDNLLITPSEIFYLFNLINTSTHNIHSQELLVNNDQYCADVLF